MVDGKMDGMTVVVYGLGVSGVAAAKLALNLGVERVIGVDDNATVPALEDNDELPPGLRHRCRTAGSDPADSVAAADLIILSPGVSLNHKALTHATAPVVSELAFAAGCLPSSVSVIGVTGTNGKSTTTEFAAQLLAAAAGRAVWKGGNLGTPLSELACLELQGRAHRHAVVEVSSYQLEAAGAFAPDAACLLNLTPDHLERHGTLQQYGATKMRIFQRMSPSSPKLLSPDCLPYAQRELLPAGLVLLDGTMPGIALQGGSASMQLPRWSEPQSLDLAQLRMSGAHNKSNAAVAAYLAMCVEPALRLQQVQDSIASLEGPPHRMQLVADIDGVRWLDDSKATNVAAAEAALSSLATPAIVLLGGQGKRDAAGRLGFARLCGSLREHLGVVTFGADSYAIAFELMEEGITVDAICATLHDATRAAARLSCVVHATCVILSPGCASFDEFSNYEERGDRFLSYVPQAVEMRRSPV